MAVHATSLADLNALAANPPQYPHNPTEELREPLTLYLSRVPGTRDVILSTFKPQRKNVTAEDVASALYYVHLDLPSDALLASPASERTSAEFSNASPIHRKPVPGKEAGEEAPPLPERKLEPLPPLPVRSREASPQRLAQRLPPPPPPRDAPWVPPGFHLDEKHRFDRLQIDTAPAVQPLVQASAQPLVQSPPTTPQLTPRPSISRKPVGARPHAPGSNASSQLDVRVPAIGALPSAPSSSSLVSNTASLASSGSPTTDRFRTRPSLPAPRTAPFSLTLIRRDPSSQHQWNIGKVTSEGDSIATAAATGTGYTLDPTAEQPVICIRLDASGYTKFRRLPGGQAALEAARDAARLGRSLDPHADFTFTRQVVMAYGKSWTAGLRQAFRRHDRATSDTAADGSGAVLDAPRRRPQSYVREAAPTATADPLLTRPGPGLKPRGYVFSSPWDGQCEFRTGNGGRSLKCRHYVPDGGATAGGGGGGGSAGFNPLVLAQNIRDGQNVAVAAARAAGGRARAGSLTAAMTGTAAVSELRFNLPSGDLFRDDASTTTDASKPDRYGWLHQHGRRRSASSDESDDASDDPESLAIGLGREAAGGGNRGKRAKLGKLIIYDEGFKMLDLVVAANLGMWWVSWEKSF